MKKRRTLENSYNTEEFAKENLENAFMLLKEEYTSGTMTSKRYQEFKRLMKQYSNFYMPWKKEWNL